MRKFWLMVIYLGLLNVAQGQESGAVRQEGKEISEDYYPEWLKDKNFSEVIVNDITLRREIWNLSLEHNNIKHLIIAHAKELNQLREKVLSSNEGMSEEKLQTLWEQDLKLAKADFELRLNDYLSQQQLHVDAIKDMNYKTIALLNEGSVQANQRLNQLISILTFAFGLISLIATVLAIRVQITLKKIEEAKEFVIEFKEMSKAKFASVRLLNKESKLTLKLVDIKDNYRLYFSKIQANDNPSVLFLRSFLTSKVQDAIKEIESCQRDWNKVSDNEDLDLKQGSLEELTGNISYLYAVMGMINYHQYKELASKDEDLAAGQYHAETSFFYFTLAHSANPDRLPDRAFNKGCIAAVLYYITDDKSYLKVVVDCYIELKKFMGKPLALLNDSDVIPINLEVRQEIAKREA